MVYGLSSTRNMFVFVPVIIRIAPWIEIIAAKGKYWGSLGNMEIPDNIPHQLHCQPTIITNKTARQLDAVMERARNFI